MAWRIVGGLGGWLASLAPLVVVNALALVTTISPEVISIAGGAGLIAGIALGGLTAGLLGARRGAGWGGTVAGAIAAALVTATLLGLMYVLRARDQLPYLLALHPVRTIVAIGFVACLLMAVAAGVGAFAGSRQERRAEWSLASRSSSGRQPSGPVSGSSTRPNADGRAPRESARLSRPAQPPLPPQRGPRESRPGAAGSYTRERSSRW